MDNTCTVTLMAITTSLLPAAPNAYLPTLPSGTTYTGYRSLVQLTIDSLGNVHYGDLCTTASNLNMYIPPDGRLYWRYNQSFKNLDGRKKFTPSHILMDPVHTNQVFVTGTQGFYRTTAFNPTLTDNSMYRGTYGKRLYRRMKAI